MTLPQSLPEALAMIGTLLQDPNLWLGAFVVVVLAVSAGGALALLSRRPR